MSFSLAENIITQTGTDTSLVGLSLIAEVQIHTYGVGLNTYSIYNIGAGQLRITGTLSINPEIELLVQSSTTANAIEVRSTATLNLGTETTSSGYTRYSYGEVIQQRVNAGNGYSTFSIEVKSGGTLNWHGGIINSKGSMGLRAGSTYTIRDGKFIGDKNRFMRMFSSDADIVGLEVVNAQTLIYTTLNNLKGLQPIQADQALQSTRNGGSLVVYGPGGGYTPNTDFIVIEDYEAKGAIHDILVLDFVRADIKNSVNGSNISIASWLITEGATHRRQGYVKVTKDIKFKIVNEMGVAVEGAKVYISDYNHQNRQNSAGYNDLADKVYTLTTGSNGETPVTNIVTAINNKADAGATGGQVPTDHRSKNGDGDDIFDMFVWSYLHGEAIVTNELKGAGILNIDWNLFSDQSISEINLATVQAYTGISINHTLSTITISESHTLDEIYDFVKSNKLDNPASPTSEILAVSTFGEELRTAYNFVISINSILSAGLKFKSLKSTGLITINAGSDITSTYFDSTFDTILNLIISLRFDTVSIHNTADDSDSGDNPLFFGTLVRFNSADHSGSIYYLRFVNTLNNQEDTRIQITMPTTEGKHTQDFSFGENAQLSVLIKSVSEISSNLEIINNNVKDGSLLIPATREV